MNTCVFVSFIGTYKSACEYLEKSKYSSEVEMFSSDGDLPLKKKSYEMQTFEALPSISANAGPSMSDYNRLEGLF